MVFGQCIYIYIHIYLIFLDIKSCIGKISQIHKHAVYLLDFLHMLDNITPQAHTHTHTSIFRPSVPLATVSKALIFPQGWGWELVMSGMHNDTPVVRFPLLPLLSLSFSLSLSLAPPFSLPLPSSLASPPFISLSSESLLCNSHKAQHQNSAWPSHALKTQRVFDDIQFDMQTSFFISNIEN